MKYLYSIFPLSTVEVKQEVKEERVETLKGFYLRLLDEKVSNKFVDVKASEIFGDVIGKCMLDVPLNQVTKKMVRDSVKCVVRNAEKMFIEFDNAFKKCLKTYKETKNFDTFLQCVEGKVSDETVKKVVKVCAVASNKNIGDFYECTAGGFRVIALFAKKYEPEALRHALRR